MITRPLTFTGNKLTLNFSTSAAGGVKVELQDIDGKAIPGFASRGLPGADRQRTGSRSELEMRRRCAFARRQARATSLRAQGRRRVCLSVRVSRMTCRTSAASCSPPPREHGYNSQDQQSRIRHEYAVLFLNVSCDLSDERLAVRKRHARRFSSSPAAAVTPWTFPPSRRCCESRLGPRSTPTAMPGSLRWCRGIACCKSTALVCCGTRPAGRSRALAAMAGPLWRRSLTGRTIWPFCRTATSSSPTPGTVACAG